MVMGAKKKAYKKKDSMESAQEAVIEKDKSLMDKNSRKNAITPPGNKKTELENNPLSIKLNSSNLMETVIYSEILGKPRCMRRGRWR